MRRSSRRPQSQSKRSLRAQVHTRPADYDLYFMYGGQQYSLDVSSGVYHAYEGRTGEEFDMVLITKVYDNDTVKRELVFPEEAQ